MCLISAYFICVTVMIVTDRSLIYALFCSTWTRQTIQATVCSTPGHNPHHELIVYIWISTSFGARPSPPYSHDRLKTISWVTFGLSVGWSWLCQPLSAQLLLSNSAPWKKLALMMLLSGEVSISIRGVDGGVTAAQWSPASLNAKRFACSPRRTRADNVRRRGGTG